MKFQHCILINFVTDARVAGQAESNTPPQLFQNWGHKNLKDLVCPGLEISFWTYSSCGASGLNFSHVLTPVELVLKSGILKETKHIIQ